MTVMKKYLIAFSISTLFLLAACNKSEDKTTAQLTPVLPMLKAKDLADLSRNELDELERRCLGLTHPTCTELKSDDFKKWMKTNTLICDFTGKRCENIKR
jgi:hypothetical protein